MQLEGAVTESLRTVRLSSSTTMILPARSTAIPNGDLSLAADAGPQSPSEPQPPATVVMMPAASTLRIRLFQLSVK